jgi:hypothetical protein
MPTHRQQSFLATLWAGNRPVNTLDNLIGKPAWVNWLGVPLTAPHVVGTMRDDSAMLSCHRGESQHAMTLYFRHTADGYRLYVREPGKHFGKGVVAQDGAYLGVKPTPLAAPSLFALRRANGKAASFSELPTDTNLITLACNGAAISRCRRVNSTYEYLAAKNETAQLWVLKILERNVPWLSSSDET